MVNLFTNLFTTPKVKDKARCVIFWKKRIYLLELDCQNIEGWKKLNKLESVCVRLESVDEDL